MAAAVGLLLLVVTVPNLGPVFRAARADGTAGTFTAEEVRCVQHPGHESCTWYGTFRPGDRAAGSGSGETDVHLYGAGRNSLRTGEQVAAVDVGRGGRVYPPDGSREWIPAVLVLLLGVVLLVPLTRWMIVRARSAA